MSRLTSYRLPNYRDFIISSIVISVVITIVIEMRSNKKTEKAENRIWYWLFSSFLFFPSSALVFCLSPDIQLENQEGEQAVLEVFQRKEKVKSGIYQGTRRGRGRGRGRSCGVEWNDLILPQIFLQICNELPLQIRPMFIWSVTASSLLLKSLHWKDARFGFTVQQNILKDKIDQILSALLFSEVTAMFKIERFAHTFPVWSIYRDRATLATVGHREQKFSTKTNE